MLLPLLLLGASLLLLWLLLRELEFQLVDPASRDKTVNRQHGSEESVGITGHRGIVVSSNENQADRHEANGDAEKILPHENPGDVGLQLAQTQLLAFAVSVPVKN